MTDLEMTKAVADILTDELPAPVPTPGQTWADLEAVGDALHADLERRTGDAASSHDRLSTGRGWASELVDLDTGERFRGVLRTTWVPE